MSHTNSVFNNSCFKLPRNPKSSRPLPVYEQKYLNQLRNESIKLDLEDTKMKSKKSDKQRVKEFIEFYGSIPEYDDLHHLSNKEFYKRIDALKVKQKSFDFQSTTDWIDEYKNLCITEKTVKKKPKPNLKPFCSTPILNKSPKLNKEEVESLSDKEAKPPSRRSVRIETPSSSPELARPKSRFISSASSKEISVWEDSSTDDFKIEIPLETKSAPSSPTKLKPTVGWKDTGITIPKPFQMTIRDEENKIVEEVLTENNQIPKGDKSEMFKAHPIPIESQIPLFDKIMAEQEFKNQITREKRKAELQSQMRPFSFTKRDEEIQNITRELSKSSPNLYLCETPFKTKKFRAKPIPKNLFSNYVYKKMHEDEFYRALQKKIRAEEMLRASSLPPSMARREKTQPKYDLCPRSFRDLEPKKRQKTPKFRINQDFEAELEELKREFLSTSKYRRSRKKIRKGYKYNNSASNSNSSRTQSSLELHSVNRSNLAAVLRIQSARRKLQMDLLRKLEETRLKQEALWKERIMRKKPVWQSLAYSHEEDLAMRLQMRREEEKLRSEEHRLRMQMMLGRVSQQPTLFERQSQMKFPKTRQKLIDHLHLESEMYPKKSASDLSSMIEMKDEEIQVFLKEEPADSKEEGK